MSGSLSTFGKLVGDPSRADIMTALIDGRAHTGNELARHVGIAPSTASAHLAKLLDGGLVTVEPQGRHRYWRIAGPEIAELIERVGAASTVAAVPGPTVPSKLRYARTCYDHLAGVVAVAIFERLRDRGHLDGDGDGCTLTPSGRVFLAELGVDMAALDSGRRPLVRACVDWSQRRRHLAGGAGRGLLDALVANDWVRRGPEPRSATITDIGHRQLADQLGLVEADLAGL